MKNNVIQSQEIDQNKKYLGNKTLNLQKLVDWGFHVPKFIAIPSHISSNLYSDENLKKEIAQEAIRILQCKKYAVRSSALIEDGENRSFAGQFNTKLNLSSNELIGGIGEVLKQANDFLHDELDKFSIIIQEYIAPDISGVTFTRNPHGSREMIIEYGFCEGEKIVSGEIKPEKTSFYWNEQDIKLPKQFLTNRVIKKFKEIENKSKFPQDIEWCIKDNKFYLLQTRPITTITSKQYEQINFLEKQLSEREEYFFEKTEISEIAPRPTEFTLSLLKTIYSQNGPVSRVYKKYGVNFTDTNFLKIIGNELFVDKEREIQGLLPCYSYLQNQNFVPKFSYYSQMIPTIKNLFFLNKIRTNGYEKIFQDLKTRIETTNQGKNYQTALKVFLEDYKLIFETNLLSGLAIKKLNSLLKNEVVKLPDILNESSVFIDLNKYKVSSPQNLKGNSLEIADESNFSATEKTERQSSDKVSQWWKKISDFKKKILQDKIKEAIIYNRLRELGRCLTIKNINAIRNFLLSYAKNQGFNDLQNIYFTSINEVINDRADKIVCKKRKNIYDQYNDYKLPNSITSSFIQKRTGILGVSAGLTQGILQNHEYLDSEKSDDSKIILYTEILSPNLTKYFDRISGIVSENGGLLSHLAIVARENNIPVITGFSLSNSILKLGNSVQIDGSNGKIEKIQ
ncbi:MAG: PEP/pyruvate-binding domain-containing protein [Candidatus Magasanikbacteria bacterium]